MCEFDSHTHTKFERLYPSQLVIGWSMICLITYNMTTRAGTWVLYGNCCVFQGPGTCREAQDARGHSAGPQTALHGAVQQDRDQQTLPPV